MITVEPFNRSDNRHPQESMDNSQVEAVEWEIWLI